MPIALSTMTFSSSLFAAYCSLSSTHVRFLSSTEALNLGFPAAEQRSEGMVYSRLDLVAEHLEVEEDLNAFH